MYLGVQTIEESQEAKAGLGKEEGQEAEIEKIEAEAMEEINLPQNSQGFISMQVLNVK